MTARAIVADRANAILDILDMHSLAAILQAVHQDGAAPNVTLSITGYDHDQLHQFGPALAGVSIPLYFLPFETGGPALARYAEAVGRYAPQLGNPNQEFALRSYIETDMFLRGLQEAGPCPTRESFIRGMHTITSYDANGLIAPIDIKNNFGRQQTCYSFVRANATGTAFDVAERQLCGRIISN